MMFLGLIFRFRYAFSKPIVLSYYFREKENLHAIIQLTTAQRCRSETETFILEDLFSSVLSNFKKKCHPSENLKFNNLGIFQSLQLRILSGKNPSNFSN